MNKRIISIIALGLAFIVTAQNPVEYMEKINTYNQELMQSSWKYLSAVARDAGPKRIESLRSKSEQLVRSSLKNLNSMGAYKGDDTYRQASIKYQNHTLDLLTGQAQKLVDMEAISQKSYDALEAYILYQREVNKINAAESDKINKAQSDFAKNNDVDLIESQSELAKKIETGSKVLDYRQDMFLVYARCSMYELDMLSRINQQEGYDFTQSGITLLELVDKSKAALNDIKDVNSDLSLRRAAEKALDFYEDEAETLIPAVSEYQKSLNDFELFKKDFENSSKNQQNKEMVDEFNAKVNALNEQGKKFNDLLQKYNKQREAIYNNFNSSSETFVQKHMPAE